jgi:hypothetical protein
MGKQLLSATIFFGMNSTLKPRKYRNISNKNSFIRFAESINVWHINFYCQKTNVFIERYYIRHYKKLKAPPEAGL